MLLIWLDIRRKKPYYCCVCEIQSIHYIEYIHIVGYMYEWHVITWFKIPPNEHSTKFQAFVCLFVDFSVLFFLVCWRFYKWEHLFSWIVALLGTWDGLWCPHAYTPTHITICISMSCECIWNFAMAYDVQVVRLQFWKMETTTTAAIIFIYKT